MTFESQPDGLVLAPGGREATRSPAKPRALLNWGHAPGARLGQGHAHVCTGARTARRQPGLLFCCLADHRA